MDIFICTKCRTFLVKYSGSNTRILHSRLHQEYTMSFIKCNCITILNKDQIIKLSQKQLEIYNLLYEKDSR